MVKAGKKPTIGLLLMTAEWFKEIGATQGSFQALPKLLAKEALQIRRTLNSSGLSVVSPAISATVVEVEKAIKLFQKENVDAIVACHITWGEDRLLLHVLEKLPAVPLLLWCYTPSERLPESISMTELFRYSGPVGTLQASGPLNRLKKNFGFAFGSHKNEKAIRRIVAFSKAAQTAKNLRRIRIGVLPYRCDQMTGTYVDEFRVRKELGPELKYISINDYREICDQIPKERVEAFVASLKTQYQIAPDVTKAGLFRSARMSLGLADLAKKFNLDCVAIEDLNAELHRLTGLRPCLYVPELFNRAVVSMEAEVGAGIALWILKSLTGRPPMYTEIITYDEADNCLLMGHAGIHDARLAGNKDEILIEPDPEYRESEPDSCSMRYRVKEGPVTLLSLFSGLERFKMVISQGECVGGPAKLLGPPHAYVRLPVPISHFFDVATKSGMTQHWAIVHDDVLEELIELADLLQLDKVLILPDSR